MSTPLEQAVVRVMGDAVQEAMLYLQAERVGRWCPTCHRMSSAELEARLTGVCRALASMTGQHIDWWWEWATSEARRHRPDRSMRGTIVKRELEQARAELAAKLLAEGEPSPKKVCAAPGCSNPVWSDVATFCSMKCSKTKGAKR